MFVKKKNCLGSNKDSVTVLLIYRYITFEVDLQWFKSNVIIFVFSNCYIIYHVECIILFYSKYFEIIYLRLLFALSDCFFCNFLFIWLLFCDLLFCKKQINKLLGLKLISLNFTNYLRRLLRKKWLESNKEWQTTGICHCLYLINILSARSAPAIYYNWITGLVIRIGIIISNEA